MIDLHVIIPCLNEAASLPQLLGDLAEQQGVDLRISIADGGSTDATVSIARAAGAEVVSSGAGRGLQMNTAAAGTQADVLLFLHADSRLGDPELLQQALAKYRDARAASAIRPMAGHFAVQFDQGSAQYVELYRHMERKSRLTRLYTINGDQGLMIHRQDFQSLGGFDESLPMLEDFRIATKIFACGKWLRLPGALRTSARRFEVEGPRQRNLLMGLMITMHEAGCMEFFAPDSRVYVDQSAASRLDIRPWLAMARRLLLRGGPRPFMRRMWPVGRATRNFFWHLPYWLDLRRGIEPPGPALRAWDRSLARWLNNGFGTALGTLIACALIFGPWVWNWVEREPER